MKTDDNFTNIRTHTRLSVGECDVLRGVTQAGMSQGYNISRHPAVLLVALGPFVTNATYKINWRCATFKKESTFLVTNRDVILS